jgi:hypothetical protein
MRRKAASKNLIGGNKDLLLLKKCHWITSGKSRVLDAAKGSWEQGGREANATGYFSDRSRQTHEPAFSEPGEIPCKPFLAKAKQIINN